MRVIFQILIDFKEKEFAFVLIPTIIIDKDIFNTIIVICWLSFHLTIEL